MQRFYNNGQDGDSKFELCMDEVGRGCLFGRVYVACVVLPKQCSDTFDGTDIKDSKKFTSKKKIRMVADRIKEQALAWHIAYIENDVIDEINILQAVMKGMHECIKETLIKLDTNVENAFAVIDGNYFIPYRVYNTTSEVIQELPHATVEKGDSRYIGIAAASILAKVARDDYILNMCGTHPLLKTQYSLDTNMGYGTKKHLDGIKEFGITQWHRRTFGELCKTSTVTMI
uniref:Ribonuclease HII n=1 Tax=viral metagenome TaxID=1070528 RepID=A0A6C0I4I5_9ZZZZ